MDKKLRSHMDEQMTPVSEITTDYDKILLSFKERRILRRILKQGELPARLCTPKQISMFEQHGLINVNRDTEVSLGYGVKGTVPGEPKTVSATDKAYRYFLYRKEDCFKDKIPVIIALIALIKSFDVEICWLVNFISNWLSSLSAAKFLP